MDVVLSKGAPGANFCVISVDECELGPVSI